MGFCKFVKMSLPTVGRFISRPFYRHLNGVFNELDAVDDQTSEWARKSQLKVAPSDAPMQIPKSSLNRTFFYLTLAHLFSSLTGFIGLEWESTGGFTLPGALTHPYIFTRQIFPGHGLAVEGDLLCLLTGTFATCLLGTFIFTAPLARKHRLIYNGASVQLNGQKMDHRLGKGILQVRRTFRRVASKLFTCYFAGAFTFFYLSVYLNKVYVISLFSLIYWICIFPQFVFLAVFALWGLPVFLIITTWYIEKLQMSISAKISQLRKILLKPTARKVPPRVLFHHSWAVFSCLNGQVSSLAMVILEYSRFWWPFLSLIFPSYISILSYLFFVIALNQTVPLLRKAFFFAPITCFLALLYFIIYRCARIGQMNGRILQENGHFRMALIRKFTFLPVSVLLKSELFLDSERLHPFTFHYLANSRITAKTFEAILSSMAFFCLPVFKNPYLTIE